MRNHLQRRYNLLLIASLSLILTVMNSRISASFHRCLPALPVSPVFSPSNPFQSRAAANAAAAAVAAAAAAAPAGPNVSHLTRLAANLACQYASRLIHQLSLFISAVLPSFTFHHREGLTLPRARAVQFHLQVIRFEVGSNDNPW